MIWQAGDSGSINRVVSFAFNEMFCITEKNKELFGAEHLFQPVAIDLSKLKNNSNNSNSNSDSNSNSSQQLVNYVRNLEFGSNSQSTTKNSSGRFIKSYE